MSSERHSNYDHGCWVPKVILPAVTVFVLIMRGDTLTKGACFWAYRGSQRSSDWRPNAGRRAEMPTQSRNNVLLWNDIPPKWAVNSSHRRKIIAAMIVRAFLAILNLVWCTRRLTLQSGVIYFASEVTLSDGAGARFEAGETHSAGCYLNKGAGGWKESLCVSICIVCLCSCASCVHQCFSHN